MGTLKAERLEANMAAQDLFKLAPRALGGRTRGLVKRLSVLGDTDLALPVKADAQTKAVMTFFVGYRGKGDGHEYALIKRV